MGWAKRSVRPKPIPSIASPRATLELNDYSLGYNSFLSNDKFPVKDNGSNLWRLAQDARIPTLGEYQTRKGFDFYSAAAGETQDQTQTSVTGASDQSFNSVTRLAQKWTAGTSGNLSKLEVRLKNATTATGTVLVEHWTDASGSPGALVSRTSIASSDITSSYAYLTARFPDAPSVVSATSYWIVLYVQNTGSNSYVWSSTTSATTAKTSINSGTSWSATTYALNFKTHYATDGLVKGLHRAYKSNGTSATLLAHVTSLYSVNDVTGALTAIKTGLSSSATKYRSTTVNDVVYYVNGYDGLRKWDFTTESQVNATNYSLIASHKGLLFLAGGADPNAVVYSNFGVYETYTSTDLVYADAPKKGDPVTALQPLNGLLFMFTRSNKYVLAGDDNATFQVEEAPDQKGTFTQETVCADKNFMYYLSDDGVYRSNGSEAQLISKNNYEDIRTLANKDDCVLQVNKGRLYLWYASDGSAYNDRCYVWNLNYGSENGTALESLDTGAYVAQALTAGLDDDKLLVASSRIGQVYWQELDSNDYTNLGGDLNFALHTHYLTFDSPSTLKEIRYWKPRFGTSSTNHIVTCQYAVDLRDSPQDAGYVDVQGSGYIWGDSGSTWGSFFWGTTAEAVADMYVPGEYRRIQLRYIHSATRQPVKFLGHTLQIQMRRMR
jgi:hypothetical protein